MKLQQGQTWKQGELYFRIVALDRLSVEFKEMADPETRDGTHHEVTKKEFCRMIKGATVMPAKGKEDPKAAKPEATVQSASSAKAPETDKKG